VRDIKYDIGYWGRTEALALREPEGPDVLRLDELPNLVDLMEDYEMNLHFSMPDTREDCSKQAWEDSYD